LAARNSLPRELSLKSQTEIRRLFRQGKKISGKYCTLIWEVGDSYKFGVFLSKRHGKATKRNHLKRLYREAIRHNKHFLVGPLKIGVIPNATTKQPTFVEINAEIQRIFKIVGFE